MKNTQNVTIVLLLVTAAILTTMLISTYHTETAQAQVSIKQGRYIMASGPWSSSFDLVYILDIRTRQLNAYVANLQTRQIELLDSVDLSRTVGKE